MMVENHQSSYRISFYAKAESMTMDSSYKQIALLLILPLVFASVQSASYQRRQRQVRTCEPLQLKNNIILFYCKSLDMRRTLGHMIKVSTIISY